MTLTVTDDLRFVHVFDAHMFNAHLELSIISFNYPGVTHVTVVI